jgi:hypothetical protein
MYHALDSWLTTNCSAGIGTYSASEGSLNAGFLGSIKRWLSQLIDQGVGMFTLTDRYEKRNNH